KATAREIAAAPAPQSRRPRRRWVRAIAGPASRVRAWATGTVGLVVGRGRGGAGRCAGGGGGAAAGAGGGGATDAGGGGATDAGGGGATDGGGGDAVLTWEIGAATLLGRGGGATFSTRGGGAGLSERREQATGGGEDTGRGGID